MDFVDNILFGVGGGVTKFSQPKSTLSKIKRNNVCMCLSFVVKWWRAEGEREFV
jgi:hypothetical protein